MLPERYRRLWRRRLRRRPLLPFVVAAVVAVDAVLAVASDFDGELAAGFLVAQLAGLAVWATQTRRGFALRLVGVSLAIVALSALVTVPHGDADQLPIFVTVIATIAVCQMLAASGVHWLAGRRKRRELIKQHVTRFRVGTLLLATVIVAIVALIVRFGQWGILVTDSVGWSVLADSLPVAVMLALSYAARPGWRSIGVLVVLPLICLLFNATLQQRGLIDAYSTFYASQAFFIGLLLSLTWIQSKRESFTTRRGAVGLSMDAAPATLPMHLDVEA